ncbi:MAG: argininosuccinate lyase [Planctomycetota bacterium]
MSGTAGGAMWGGRFEEGPDEVFRRLNDSLPIDWRLVRHDIRGSIAWARALAQVGVYSGDELETVIAGLEAIGIEAAGQPEPPTESGAEDVHTWVEQRLIDRIGDLGKKLHTGRSRNDQVATDLRLWVREAALGLDALLAGVLHALAVQAHRHATTPFPAYTHLQSAQPVTFGHWCLAYIAMLERDRGRLSDAADRQDECPLGSAALAGTTYPVDRGAIAAELGFERPTSNSLDAIASRDHVVEVLGALATLGVHLSRLAEDLSIYTSSEFGLVELDDGVTSGSSLMPQKKNPDSLELIRGAASQLIAAPGAMLTTLKGLPMSYNKDLQYDKETLFGAADRAADVLRLAARTVAGLHLHEARALKAAGLGYANATDLADMLVAAGVPFRDAHERVGSVVRHAIDAGLAIDTLPEADIRQLLPELEPGAVRSLTVGSLLAARDVQGGTAPVRVTQEAVRAMERIDASD